MKRNKLSLIVAVIFMLTLFSPLVANAETYVVKRGDVLWKIAKNYNVTAQELAKYNNLNNMNLIYSGQKLEIPGTTQNAAPAPVSNNGAVKNVILLIGDGMGEGHLDLARIMEYGKTGKLNMESMTNTAFVTTYSDDNYVTDSAAAGTAIATGYKTVNGGIGTLADGTEVKSMTEMFKEKGKSVGLISTNTVYDATPAAFGAHASNRNDTSEIVRDLYDEQWDVILGGGTKYFAADKQNGVDMVAKFKQSGYTYVSNEEELNSVKDATKLLGLFNPEYMSYKTDRDDYNSKEPSLKEMTSTALDILSKDKDGFFMMSEGARIDHAAHAGDATGVWKETIEFDETVKYVLDWVKQHPDTLVVVTADHQTMAIAPSEAINIDALKNNVTASPEYMGLQMVKNTEGTQFTVDSIKSVIKKYSAIELTEDEALALQKKLDVKYAGYKLGYEIGSVIAKKYGVAAMDGDLRAFGKTGGHTSAWVPLFAEGKGAEKFHGVIDNTDIIKIIMDIVK